MSQANYIIICKGRIRLAVAGQQPKAKIQAISDAAAELVSHIDVMNPGKLTDADTQPITDLQHELMEQIETLTDAAVDAHAETMIGLLYDLEKKFERSGKKTSKTVTRGRLGQKIVNR